MRFIIDRNGTRWEANIVTGASHGVGSRGEYQPLPETFSKTIVFKSTDGRKVVKEAPASEIDTMTDLELIDLLEQTPE